MSQFEKGMNRLGVATDNTMFKAGGIGAALGSGVVARHYGFERLTGVEESWSDSATRFLGSAACAYLTTKAFRGPSSVAAPIKADVQSRIRTISALGIAMTTVGKDFNPFQFDKYNRTKEMLERMQAPIENRK